MTKEEVNRLLPGRCLRRSASSAFRSGSLRGHARSDRPTAFCRALGRLGSWRPFGRWCHCVAGVSDLLQTSISRSKVALSAAVLTNDVSLSKWCVKFSAKQLLQSSFFIVRRRRRMKSVATSPSTLRERGLEQMVASGGKPSPQTVVAPNGFANRRRLRLVSSRCCREDVLETIVINSREVLTQDRGGKVIRP